MPRGSSRGFSFLPEIGLWLSDNTIGDATTARHGFVPKAPNDTTKFWRGDATWASPSSSVGSLPKWLENYPLTLADPDAFPENDDFSTGSNIDTAGSRFTGAKAWTARLVTGLTESLDDKRLVLTLPQTTSVVREGYTQAVDASGDRKYRCAFWMGGKSVDYHGVSMFVERNTGASRKTIHLNYGFDSASSANEVIRLQRFTTDSDTAGATITQDTTANLETRFMLCWLEIEISGTDMHFRHSFGPGLNMRFLATEAEATHLGGRADRIGIALLNGNNTNGDMTAWFEWFGRIT